MSLDPNELMGGIGDDESVGFSAPVPKSVYPAHVALAKAEPSASKGTAGLHLNVTITDGPFAGNEIDKFASVWWMWAPKEDAKPATKARRLGFMKHITKIMTGKDVDGAAFEKFGADFSSIESFVEDFFDWYRDLDQDVRIEFLTMFLRLKLWTGKDLMVHINCNEEEMQNAEGEPLLDENTGEPRMRDRNEISNVFELNHSRYGFAAFKGMYCKQQEAAYAAMYS